MNQNFNTYIFFILGWATGHEEVRLTPEFILNAPGSSSSVAAVAAANITDSVTNSNSISTSNSHSRVLKQGDEEHQPVHPPNITLTHHHESEHQESEHPVTEHGKDEQESHKLLKSEILKTDKSVMDKKEDLQKNDEEDESEQLPNPPIIEDAPKRFNIDTDLGN